MIPKRKILLIYLVNLKNMIKLVDKPFTEEESLSVLNHYVREWFRSKFKELTPPQLYTFKIISEGHNILVTAPTGSGKTLAGFLAIISKLIDLAERNQLDDKIYCVYVSPLRSLNNDIYRNLTEPIEEIYNMIKDRYGVELKKISIGIRTGDTTASDRQKQLRKPPNILITTPETLSIALSTTKFKEAFKTVRYVIVDELHELVSSKRGVHLSLSLERLQRLAENELIRIGLSATIYPLDEAAKFLVGLSNGEPRECLVVNAGWSKKFDIKTLSPARDLININETEIEDKAYKLINDIVQQHRTTLIFTNTRSGTERVVFNLKRRFGFKDEEIAAHHSSLSRNVRLEVEENLKKGKFKCVVTSTSLELGIDIGSIDDVIQVGSPKSITRAIQRIGRSGHSYKATARGQFIVMNRDDLIECSIMSYYGVNRYLDSFQMPRNCLDVLAQHIVGMAIEDVWDVDDAFMLIRSAYPYKDLSKEDYLSVLKYLAGEYVSLESRKVYAKIWLEDNRFGKRGKTVRVIYFQNTGTIPDEVSINVISLENKKWIGTIEEEFLEKLKPGDIFTLGGKLYKFQYSRLNNCYVVRSDSKQPTIPPWFSEELPLSFDLALKIGEFRRLMFDLVKDNIKELSIYANYRSANQRIKKVLDNLPTNDEGKEAILRYFVEQYKYCKEIGSDKEILAELTDNIDNKDTFYIIFHSLFGRRVNDTLSRMLSTILAEKLDTDIRILVNDNGFLFEIDSYFKDAIDKDTIEELFNEIINKDRLALLRRNIINTELMKRKFRHVAARGFMILRRYIERNITVRKQQLNAMSVLKVIKEEYPDFPILKETYREIFEDTMDIRNTEKILDLIKKGDIKVVFIKTRYPSPFSHNIITFGHADVTMIEEKRMQLRKLYNLVIKSIKEDDTR
ncbi:MAG: ATP-dependent DNA helicase Hel308 [Candidatus Micrarchaeota archaeon]|nr:MAG: ATP-dependent DNA helicase Hel308 [Candidatus Micrarchaeota archaeon]